MQVGSVAVGGGALAEGQDPEVAPPGFRLLALKQKRVGEVELDERAPEIFFEGLPEDGDSDLYCLALCAYELLTTEFEDASGAVRTLTRDEVVTYSMVVAGAVSQSRPKAMKLLSSAYCVAANRGVDRLIR